MLKKFVFVSLHLHDILELVARGRLPYLLPAFDQVHIPKVTFVRLLWLGRLITRDNNWVYVAGNAEAVRCCHTSKALLLFDHLGCLRVKSEVML